jgi:hypothetical protein
MKPPGPVARLAEGAQTPPCFIFTGGPVVGLVRRSFLRGALAAPLVAQGETDAAGRGPPTGDGSPDASGTSPRPAYPSQPEDWWKRATERS